MLPRELSNATLPLATRACSQVRTRAGRAAVPPATLCPVRRSDPSEAARARAGDAAAAERVALRSLGRPDGPVRWGQAPGPRDPVAGPVEVVVLPPESLIGDRSVVAWGPTASLVLTGRRGVVGVVAGGQLRERKVPSFDEAFPLPGGFVLVRGGRAARAVRLGLGAEVEAEVELPRLDPCAVAGDRLVGRAGKGAKAELAAFDLDPSAFGREVWRRRVGETSALVVGPTRLLVARPDGLAALALEDGAQAWSAPGAVQLVGADGDGAVRLGPDGVELLGAGDGARRWLRPWGEGQPRLWGATRESIVAVRTTVTTLTLRDDDGGFRSSTTRVAHTLVGLARATGELLFEREVGLKTSFSERGVPIDWGWLASSADGLHLARTERGRAVVETVGARDGRTAWTVEVELPGEVTSGRAPRLVPRDGALELVAEVWSQERGALLVSVTLRDG